MVVVTDADQRIRAGVVQRLHAIAIQPELAPFLAAGDLDAGAHVALPYLAGGGDIVLARQRMGDRRIRPAADIEPVMGGERRRCGKCQRAGSRQQQRGKGLDR